MIVCNDVVQNPEQQCRKKHSKKETSLPDGSSALVHIAEFLKQVEGAGLERYGWVGRDTWFGRASSCV